MKTEICCDCWREFTDDKHECEECKIVLCESCWSNHKGLCIVCSEDKFYDV